MAFWQLLLLQIQDFYLPSTYNVKLQALWNIVMPHVSNLFYYFYKFLIYQKQAES